MSRREVYAEGRLVEWSEVQGGEYVRAWLDFEDVWQEERRPVTAEERTRDALVANADTVRGRVSQALEVNRAFLAQTSPTAAQTAAQVRALTRQMSALARITLGQFDAAD